MKRRRRGFLKFLIPMTIFTIIGTGIFNFFKGKEIFNKDNIKPSIEETIELPEVTSETIETSKVKKATPETKQEIVSEEIEEFPEEVVEFPEEVVELPEEVVELPEIIVPEEVIETDLLDIGYEFKSIDFEELLKENEDTIGWIHIDGTKVDYPIMHGDDNEFYSNHDIDGNKSVLGSIYLDANNNPFEMPIDDLDDLSFIYGHHITKGRMFSTICKYKDQDFYEEYPFFVIYTPDGYAYKADVFAGVIYSGKDNSIYNDNYSFDDEEDFANYMDYLKENSLISSDLSVEYGDKIVCLVTCTYENGSNGNLRFIVFARLSKQYTNELQREEGPRLGLK